MAGPEDPNGEADQGPAVRKTDTLNYLCEIIYELKHLADSSGQRTLSAILAAALTEARIQNDHARR
jgi:hypothetical protein